jgi:D-sedoheptulose 7-phosphate isomerase
VSKVIIEARFQETANNYLALRGLAETIAQAAEALIDRVGRGGKIIFCGNGGSASDAQHLASELTGRFLLDREPLPALALTCSGATLTSIANDYGYEASFERQVRALGRENDALIGISTSGNSANVVAALKVAQDLGLLTVGLTGQQAGLVDEYTDYVLKVPSATTPRIQEMHIAVGHVICELIEKAFV